MLTLDDIVAITKPHNDKLVAEGRLENCRRENARLTDERDALLQALQAIAQRANESGTGEMGLLDTIHAMHAIARAAIVAATGTAGPQTSAHGAER